MQFVCEPKKFRGFSAPAMTHERQVTARLPGLKVLPKLVFQACETIGDAGAGKIDIVLIVLEGFEAETIAGFCERLCWRWHWMKVLAMRRRIFDGTRNIDRKRRQSNTCRAKRYVADE